MRDAATVLALRTEPAPSPDPVRVFRNGRGWTDQQTAGCANLPAMTRGALFDAFACKLIAIRAKMFVIARAWRSYSGCSGSAQFPDVFG